MWIACYAIAIFSGWMAQLIHTPLPWMLGPLVSIAMLSALGVPLKAPRMGRNIGQWFIGIAIGLYFTPLAVSELKHDVPYILLACLLSTILLAFGTWMLWRFFHISLRTAFFASAMGGASEMTVLAERHNERADLVAAAHSLRLLLILLIIPLLFKIWGEPGNLDFSNHAIPTSFQGICILLALSALGIALFHRLKLPNAFLLGPLLVSGVLTALGIEFSSWPKYLSLCAQTLIGVGLGVRFTRDFVLHAKNLALGISIYTFIAGLMSVLFSLSITKFSGLDVESLILSTVPGGMAEMGITANVLHLNVPAVTVFHITRMAFVILSAELFFHQVLGRLERKFDLGLNPTAHRKP